MKGKFGRILGNFVSINGEKCAAVLIREGHAVEYNGESKRMLQVNICKTDKDLSKKALFIGVKLVQNLFLTD